MAFIIRNTFGLVPAGQGEQEQPPPDLYEETSLSMESRDDLQRPEEGLEIETLSATEEPIDMEH